MQIIIKPMGFVVLIASVIGLSALAVLQANRLSQSTIETAERVISLTAAPGSPADKFWDIKEAVVNSGAISVVALSDGPANSREALRVRVTKATPENPASVQGVRWMTRSFTAGQRLTLRFWARSSERRPMSVAFEQTASPFAKDLDWRIGVSPEWQPFSTSFVVGRDYGSLGSRLSFQVGEAAGGVEFTGVEIVAPPPVAPGPGG
jgi:hypothetical protein